MAHRAGGAQGERGQIERERSQLVKEEDSLQMAVQQMQRDIAQLRETITNLGNYWWRIHVYIYMYVCNDIVGGLADLCTQITNVLVYTMPVLYQ